MTTHRLRLLLVVAAVLAVVATLLPSPAAAIPVFARKYGFQCTMCHSNMPRLNDFGLRYRLNGYRLPGRESEEKTVLESPAPVAFRTSAGYVGVDRNEAAGNYCESDFRVEGLDILSAGLLGRKIGYMLIYTPQIDAVRGAAPQDGALEMANVVFGGLAGSNASLRVGRFEPAFLAASVKRRLTVSPYEIYEYAFPDGPAFSETRSGLEVAGWRNRLHYAGGVVTGSETNRSYDTPSDLYGRVDYVIGPGEGQTAGHRIGAVGYYGRARPSPALGGTATALEGFSRAGIDASLNAMHVNLVLAYLWAFDGQTLWTAGDGVDYSGGFAEVSAMPRVDAVCFGRIDYVNAPSVADNDITRYTAGARYYPIDNLAMHLEYSYWSECEVVANEDATEHYVTARLDFAF